MIKKPICMKKLHARTEKLKMSLNDLYKNKTV